MNLTEKNDEEDKYDKVKYPLGFKYSCLHFGKGSAVFYLDWNLAIRPPVKTLYSEGTIVFMVFATMIAKIITSIGLIM